MRLDKVLAHMGFGSRKEVKELIKKSKVTVNDDVMKNGKYSVNPYEDEIMVNHIPVDYRKYIYIMLNKPAGFLSATEDIKDQTVVELLEPEFQLFDPFPVGRLDKDTEGLLLLTNNGQLAHQLLSPKKEVEKTYYAKVRGRVTVDDINAFNKGVTLDDGYHTKPARLDILTRGPISEIELTITEGKFHQVKRMFEAVDKEVIYLRRERMGELYLDESLPLGDYRELTNKELEYCLSLIPKEIRDNL